MNNIPLIMGLLLALMILFVGISDGITQSKRYDHVYTAAKTAVRAGLEDEVWDLDRTANAGEIVLDEVKAKQFVEGRFFQNQDIVDSATVYVINNAPVTFSRQGKTKAFTNNGVALIYTLDGRTILNTAEVEDE